MLLTSVEIATGVRVFVEKEDDLVCTITAGLTINTTSVSTTVSSRGTYLSLPYNSALTMIRLFYCHTNKLVSSANNFTVRSCFHYR